MIKITVMVVGHMGAHVTSRLILVARDVDDIIRSPNSFNNLMQQHNAHHVTPAEVFHVAELRHEVIIIEFAPIGNRHVHP